MSGQTWFLGLFVATLFGGLALVIYHASGKNRLWPLRKRKKVRNWLLVLAASMTLFTFWTDHDLRGKTLFEISDDWEMVANHDWTFLVENPGVEHQLLVSPRAKWGKGTFDTFTIRHTLLSPDHQVIVDATTSFRRQTKNRYRAVPPHEPANFRFTPASRGPHRLSVKIEAGPAPLVMHLRVADPLKKDGKRAKGF